jgi:hypothetical protein
MCRDSEGMWISAGRHDREWRFFQLGRRNEKSDSRTQANAVAWQAEASDGRVEMVRCVGEDAWDSGRMRLAGGVMDDGQADASGKGQRLEEELRQWKRGRRLRRAPKVGGLGGQGGEAAGRANVLGEEFVLVGRADPGERAWEKREEGISDGRRAGEVGRMV